MLLDVVLPFQETFSKIQEKINFVSSSSLQSIFRVNVLKVLSQSARQTGRQFVLHELSQ